MTSTANAPTIADIKANAPEGLWQFLSALPASFEAQLFYGLLIFGLIGMTANYFQRWARDEIQGNLVCYLFLQHPKRTLLSFMSYIGLVAAAISTGVFKVDGQFVGWYNVIWIALTTAFTVDVLGNKGETKVWSPAARAEKREEIAEKKAEDAKP